WSQMNVSLNRLLILLQGGPAEQLSRHSQTGLRGNYPAVPQLSKGDEHRLEQLVAEHLSYRYPGSERGIEDIHLRLERGKFTVITGRIGSGKTTLLRVLLGLLPKQSGQVYWNGQQVDELASFFVPPRCSYTPQVPRLFSLTLKDNIL